jgi:hypothetical protein
MLSAWRGFMVEMGTSPISVMARLHHLAIYTFRVFCEDTVTIETDHGQRL